MQPSKQALDFPTAATEAQFGAVVSARFVAVVLVRRAVKVFWSPLAEASRRGIRGSDFF